MKSNIEKLVDSLKESGNVRFAKKVEEHYARNYCDSATAKEYYSLLDIGYKLFLSLIDNESSAKLRKLDKKISELTKKIEKGNGWNVSRTGAVMYDNFRNMHDPEFRSYDTHLVGRKENGYVPTPCDYGACRDDCDSISFVKKYQSDLDELHNLYSQKERIMYGSFSLKNPEDYILALNLSAFLGFEGDSEVLRLMNKCVYVL